MYLAELRGKLPSALQRSEDILTSNVFSFFKYADRRTYLKRLLTRIQLDVPQKALEEAEFLFWPRYDDGTEPDLVMLIGDFYVLFEAKFLSGFSKGTDSVNPQILREIQGGLREAEQLGKKFLLVAITADYYFKPEILSDVPAAYRRYVTWMKWHDITAILLKLIELGNNDLPDLQFANDLYDLLRAKGLRDYQSFERLADLDIQEVGERVFLLSETARFEGFPRSLGVFSQIGRIPSSLFYSSTYFRNFGLAPVQERERIFFRKEIEA